MLKIDFSGLSSSVRLLLKAALVLILLGYLCSKGLIDFAGLGHILQRPRFSALVFAVLVLSNLVGAYRWRLLLKGQGFALSLYQVFELTYIGYFFNTVLPGVVGGDLFKGYLLLQRDAPVNGKSKAMTAILLDRVLGVSGLICVSFVAVVFGAGTALTSSALRPVGALAVMLFAGVVALYVFIMGKWKLKLRIRDFLGGIPFGERLVKVFDAIRCYENSPLLVLEGFALSAANHCALVGLVFALSRVLPGFEAVPIRAFFLLVPLGFLVTALLVAPGGLGTGHAAFYALFKLFHSDRGADLFNAYAAFQILSSLIGGMLYLRSSHGRPVRAFESIAPSPGS